MHGSFCSAQLAHDFAVPPGTYSPEPQPTNRELREKLWEVATACVTRNANAEVLGGPSITQDHNSIDLTIGCATGCEVEIPVLLRAMADAWEQQQARFGQLGE